MLKLADLIHLPQVEPLVAQLVAGGPGLVVVAGLDPRPVAPANGFLPSGRATIQRLLMRHILEEHPGLRATVVARGEEAIRIPRPLRRRIEISRLDAGHDYAAAIARAAGRRPGLLVVDQLTAESAPPALEAARSGLWLLSQLDTIFYGAEVARHLLDLGLPPDLLPGLAWVVSVQRLPTLCATCRQPAPPPPEQLADWCRRYPLLADTLQEGTYFRAGGCRRCRHTGRDGEVTALDLFRAEAAGPDLLVQPSQLPLEAYLLGLVARGQLPLEDLNGRHDDRLRRTYHLLVASEAAAGQARATLERRLAELEAANRVLQQRTEALISLESIGQALIASTTLAELAARLCRDARNLCGADRAILYFRPPEEAVAQVLAVSGWDPALVGRPLDAAQLLEEGLQGPARPFDGWPPGVPRQPTDRTSLALRAGLWVPLVAQEHPVGLMIVHTSQKAAFAPGEVALLQAFGNQAALAIQRAGLVQDLQDKIVQLEAAQAELVQKERLERELELARQVQQSVLPRTFPLLPGYRFAARSRAARWVGGDFYDVILLDAGRFALVIGDVSDKGMAAALFMAQTHSLLRAESRRGTQAGSPRAVLSSVHRLLQELGRADMFVTVFYALVDAPRRQLTYTRAGHDHPLLVRDGRVHPLGGQGTVIGFPGLDDLQLSEEEFDLAPGD
ncbi:MAG: SpoIIE family protein phosphatase, partial [Anaerolineae bacterium]